MSALDDLRDIDFEDQTPIQRAIVCYADIGGPAVANKAAAELAALRAELEAANGRLARMLDLVRQAHIQLNATQNNWQENCLFECNDLLKQIINETE